MSRGRTGRLLWGCTSHVPLPSRPNRSLTLRAHARASGTSSLRRTRARRTGALRARELCARESADPPLRACSSARLSFLACEIFACEIDALFTTLLEEDGQLFAVLFSFLDNPAPLNSVLCGYFSRVVCSLLGRRAIQTLAMLQAQPVWLERLAAHAGSTSCCEILLRLVGADDGPLAGHPDAQAWLVASPLVSRLLDSLGPESSPGAQAAAADLLQAIARTAPSDLSASLAHPGALGRLFSQGLLNGPASCGRGLSFALDVAMALMDPRPPRSALMVAQQGEEKREGCVEPSRMAGAALPHFASLVSRLSRSGDSRIVATSWGMLRPPLGFDRLKVVEFLGAMLRTGSPPVREAYMRLQVASHCCDLLACYPLHSALHGAVEAQLGYALGAAPPVSGGPPGEPGPAAPLDPTLLRHLLAPPVDLAGRLASLPLTLPPAASSTAVAAAASCASIPSAHRPLPRAGYCGMLLRLGNRLHELGLGGCGGQLGWVSSALGSHPRWPAFHASFLRPGSNAEAQGRWLCGRPSRASSDLLAEAEEEEEVDEGSDEDSGSVIAALESTAATLRLSRDVYHRYDGCAGEQEQEEEEGSDDEELHSDEEEDGGAGRRAAAAGAGGGSSGSSGSSGASSDEEDDQEPAVFASFASRPDGSLDLAALTLSGPESHHPAAAAAAATSPRAAAAGLAGSEEDEDAPAPDHGDDDDVLLLYEPDWPPVDGGGGGGGGGGANAPAVMRTGGVGKAPPTGAAASAVRLYDPAPFWRAGYDAQLTPEDV